MSLIDDITDDPGVAVKLTPDERRRVMLQCSAVIMALAVVPAKESASVPAANIQTYLTVEEVAERIRRAPSTLYHWISRGSLTEDKGLRRVQGQPLIEWPVFEQNFVHGITHKR